MNLMSICTRKFISKSLSKRIAMTSMALLGSLVSLTSTAQEYPNRQIKFIVPFSAGTTTDVIGRLYAQKLGEILGQTVVVDNKAGAGGNIAAEYVARAAPDGYTLTFSTSATHATNPALYSQISFNPIKDFTHIALMVSAPNMLVVNQKIPVNNMAELIAYAKANPGKLTYISAGSGTSLTWRASYLKPWQVLISSTFPIKILLKA